MIQFRRWTLRFFDGFRYFFVFGAHKFYRKEYDKLTNTFWFKTKINKGNHILIQF